MNVLALDWGINNLFFYPGFVQYEHVKMYHASGIRSNQRCGFFFAETISKYVTMLFETSHQQ